MTSNERRHLTVRMEVQLVTVDQAEARLLAECDDCTPRRLEELRGNELEAADELERIRAQLLEVDLAMAARS